MGALGLLVFLAVLQGLTEYLPVSSSGHLVLAREFLPGGERLPEDASIEVLLHLGTLLAVILFYRREIGRLIRGALGRGEAEEVAAQRRLLALLCVGVVPLLPMILVKDWLEETLFTGTVVPGFALLVTGGFLFWSRRFDGEGKNLMEITARIALLVGIAQAVAITPGISRSGATIVAGLALGLSVDSAAAFSFLLSIPAILGASIVKLPEVLAPDAGVPPMLELATATAVSFAVGMAALGLLLWVARRRRLPWFAPYCCLAGASVLLASFAKS